MYLKHLRVGPESNFIYLVGPSEESDTAAIDPSFEIEKALAVAREDGRRISKVLLTHTHGDHTAGLADLVKKTQAQVCVHRLEAQRALAALKGVDHPMVWPLDEDDKICLGSLEGMVLHTPGHTPGGLCYLFEDKLFTGDTLFVGGCGRCDLAGGDPRILYQSLYEKLLSLSEDTIVYPGHDYGDKPISTIGQEKRTNPYLRWRTVEEFVQYRMVDYLKDKKR